MSMLLDEGELALLADAGGLDAVTAAARGLGMVSVPVLASADDDTVMAYAGSLPLIWIAAGFGNAARAWAHARGPMTLLVETTEAVTEEDRPRIERFVAILGRQAE
jgi:hypothetical protein